MCRFFSASEYAFSCSCRLFSYAEAHFTASRHAYRISKSLLWYFKILYLAATKSHFAAPKQTLLLQNDPVQSHHCEGHCGGKKCHASKKTCWQATPRIVGLTLQAGAAFQVHHLLPCITKLCCPHLTVATRIHVSETNFNSTRERIYPVKGW